MNGVEKRVKQFTFRGQWNKQHTQIHKILGNIYKWNIPIKDMTLFKDIVSALIHMIHKKWLKMDNRPEYKIHNYETPWKKQDAQPWKRQNLLTGHKH